MRARNRNGHPFARAYATMKANKRKARLLYLLLAVLAPSFGLLEPQQVVEEETNDNIIAEGQHRPLGVTETGESSAASSHSGVDPALNDKSVVLITGAAGFIGSELALALRRTYNVKKLLLVDNLGIDSENESAYVPPAANSVGGGERAIYEKLSEDDLSMFEIKRQRAFRIFHELTAGDNLDDDDDGSSRRKNDAESIRFYRADMRPSIPEFFDFGEVPLLEGIFQSHPDITHVVHLADVPINAQNQAIPRNKDSVKTGRMEGLLEEMRLMLERAAEDGNEEDVRLPQFIYASSHDVYDRISTAEDNTKQPNPPPFQEDKPITTPSSLHGTAKLIDEVLASAYHSTHGIYSVGLRFFSVYGPWSSPGADTFDLAERVIALNEGSVTEDDMTYDEDVKDYVYIDDAVDAIMTAMQYRPPGNDPPPVVFNVGTGKGSTLRELREHMTKHFSQLGTGGSQTAARSAKENPTYADRLPTKSYASTSRSESLLGFKAQMPLVEGLAHTLTWHRDRALPYGRDPATEESFERKAIDRSIDNSLSKARGGESECSPLDQECLRGAPVFPCASECRLSQRCTPSAWDDVAVLSKFVTSGCDAVLYTILLDETAEQIPSATATVSPESLPYVGAGLPEDVEKRTQARCNIAFVLESSPLVQRLRSEGEEYLDDENNNQNDNSSGGSSGLPPLLRHGFWTILPVSTPSSSSESNSHWMHAFDGEFALQYLPKISPGRFFGSSVRFAVYAEPYVLVNNIPALLKRMEDGPPIKDGGSATTVLMLPSKRSRICNDPTQRGSSAPCAWTHPGHNDSIQSRAYNMVRIALRGDMLGGGLDTVVDSSFVVHSLGEEDSRLFRCDVYGEVAQWGASSDERAMEFIISLHDLWTRAVSHWSGVKPWWGYNGGSASTTAAAAGGDGDAKDETLDETTSGRRRLLDTESSGSSGGQGHAGKWMGVLSSTEVQFFTRILPPDGVDIIHLEET